MTKRDFLLFCLTPLLLAACASDKAAPPRHCPQVAILRDLERMEDHGRDAADDPGTLVALAGMRKIEGECKYKDEEGGVDVTFDLLLAAEKGPRLGGDRVSFPYFISLIDPEDKIVRKEAMLAEFTFPSGGHFVESRESLHVFIPLKADEDASPYRVLMGFQLTEEQLKAARGKDSQ